MKRRLSILMVVLLTISMMPVLSTAVVASENLIFEMDISNYDSTNRVITNTVAGNTSTIIPYATPILEEMQSYTGTTQYLRFGSSEIVDGKRVDSNTTSNILVRDNNFLNKDEMTVEMWARARCLINGSLYYIYDRPFALGDNVGNASFDVMTNADKFHVRPNGSPITNAGEFTRSMSDYNNKWTHYVFTRKWDSTNNAWITQTIVNGVKIPELSGTIAVTGSRKDETGHVMVIGGMRSSNNSFRGDIATFRVYNTALTVDEAQTQYDTTGSSHIPAVDTMTITGVSPNGGTINPFQGKISIDFDNYIDENSLSGITLIKQNGEAIKGLYFVKPASKMSKTVEVIFGKLEEDTNYLLTISDTVKSMNNISMPIQY